MITANTFEEYRDLLVINPTRLAEGMERAPEVRAFLGEKWADADEALAHAKLSFQRVEARLRIVTREQLYAAARKRFQSDRALEVAASQAAKKAGGSHKKAEVRMDKPTTADIESHVYKHEDYVDAYTTLIEEEAETRRLKVLYDSAKSLCDMLNARGNLHNAELKARPLDIAQARSRIRGGNAGPGPVGESVALRDDDVPF